MVVALVVVRKTSFANNDIGVLVCIVDESHSVTPLVKVGVPANESVGAGHKVELSTGAANLARGV